MGIFERIMYAFEKTIRVAGTVYSVKSKLKISREMLTLLMSASNRHTDKSKWVFRYFRKVTAYRLLCWLVCNL